MFENIVGQDAIKTIKSDIKKRLFPGSVLFSGNSASGKLSAALETARVLSCTGEEKGKWTCECYSCLQHKALTCTNLMLLGPRDCSLEYAAAKDTFIKAYRDNSSYLTAARYLYLRSIRKLTVRFNGILWQGDKDINKIGAIIQDMNEDLEQLDFPRELPIFDETVKLCERLNSNALKLEQGYLYNSIPISQIRNMEDWARIKPEEGKKTVIIENADLMQTGVRNALLKILEEPPADCIFILLTTRRNAVMPTILSRVRNYTFKDRSSEKQSEVISKVFHNNGFNGSIDEYLLTYLPIPASKVREEAKEFFVNIAKGKLFDCKKVCDNCKDFKPRIELKIFLSYLATVQRGLLKYPNGCEASAETMKALRNCWENVTLYNQTTTSALETLVRDLSKINVLHDKVFLKAFN